MARGSAPHEIRLAELLGSMSLGVDLGMGQPMQHVLRQSLIALRLAQHAGLGEEDRRIVYYTSLFAWVGCHIDAYEQAKWFGDDTALKSAFRHADFSGPMAQRAFILRHLAAGSSAMNRVGTGVRFIMTGGRADAEQMIANHWRAAEGLATRLGMGTRICKSIEQTFERWDGAGVPYGARGADILVTSQLVNLADVVEVFHRTGGAEAAVAVARERSGTQFAPASVTLFCDTAADVMADLPECDAWGEVMSAEPCPQIRIRGAAFDDALAAIADFIDLKSPYTIGHSRAVATLSVGAARVLGLSADEADTVWRTAVIHDFGRLGVSNAIWDKAGPLTETETERVRMYPYLTQRMASFSPVLAPLSAIAAQHRERLDGSGYPWGLTGRELSTAARILAAADAYQTWREPRPHRPARSSDDAAARLRAHVEVGLLDGHAADAALRCAGHRVRKRGTWPAGLTSREVQVLGMVARGLSNRQIADELVIARKTVSNHVEHVYAKIGVGNRALAGLFAAEHGLIGADAVEQP